MIGNRSDQKLYRRTNHYSEPTLSRLEWFCLRCPADTTRETTERDGLIVFKHVA